MNCNLHELYIRSVSFYRLKTTNRRIYLAMKRGDKELKFGPSSINLMMADKCNSECIMCGHDYKNCGTGEKLTLEKIRTIYSHLNLSDVVDIIYGGGGEPFLNPDLPDIAKYTHILDPVIQHTVITNLIHGESEDYRSLLRSRVHFLCSINASTPDTYKIISGTHTFNNVIEHLRMLVRMREETKSLADISISMILMRQNINELCDFIRMAAREGVNGVKTLYVRIYPSDSRDKSNSKGRILPQDSLFFEQQKNDDMVIKAERLARELGIRFEYEMLFSSSFKRKQRNCIEPWKSLFINFNGDVYPCPGSEILFMKKINAGQYNSGNILKQSLMEFWNNDFWKALRSTNAGTGRKEIVPECICCGNSICWMGSNNEASHVLNWTVANQNDERL